MIFIVSTLNEKFDPYLSNLDPKNVVVVNQGICTNKYLPYDYAGVLYDDGIGLSRSRNIGLDFCSKKSLSIPWVVCDDDVKYCAGIENKLAELYNENALIQGQILLPCGTPFKNYNVRASCFKRYKDLFSLSSVEIIIADLARAKKIRFDEGFGLGSENPFGGEECLFLDKWLLSGGQFKRCPIILGEHPAISTGSRLAHVGYWSTRKQLFKLLFGYAWLVVYVLFLLKKTRSINVLWSGFRGLGGGK